MTPARAEKLSLFFCIPLNVHCSAIWQIVSSVAFISRNLAMSRILEAKSYREKSTSI